MASVLSRIQIIMEANTANYNNELKKARKNSSKTFGNIGKAAGKMALGVGAALVGMGAKAIHTAGNFEEAMNAISAVSGATGKDFDDLREKAKQLGSETAYSATEAANGMEFLAKAGMDTQQVLATIPNALSLASAGSIDLATSADILSNIMSGMGIAAEDSGRAADVLAKAAASANVDVAMLGESMKYVAPIAKQLGMSLEETTAIIGVMGNAGIQASQAGTSMRAMFTRFNTHNKANAAFAELGVSLKDANGDMRSMIDVMADLSVVTENLKPDEKLAYFKDMAGVEAMSALAVAVDAAADGSLQNLKDKLDGAKGSAEEMAAIRMEGFKGAIKGMASAFEGLQIAVADSGLLDLATGAITFLADKMRGLSKALPEITANMTAFFQSAEVAGAITATVDGLKMAWDNLVSVVERTGDVIRPVIDFFIEHEELSKSLAIAIGVVAGAIIIYNAAVVIGAAATVAFGAALAFITAPLTLAVIGITALVAAGVYLYRNWDEVKAKAVEIFGGLPAPIQAAIAIVVNIFTAQFEIIKTIVVTTWEVIKAVFTGRWGEIGSIVSEGAGKVWSIIVAKFDNIKPYVSAVWQSVKDSIANKWSEIKSDAVTYLNIFKIVMSNKFKQIKYQTTQKFIEIKDSIINTLKELPSKMLQIGADIINGLINGIKSKASAAVNAVKDTASSMYQGVKNFFIVRSPSRLMRELGVNIVDGLIVGIKDKESDAYKAAVSVANSVLDGIASTRKSISLFGKDSAVSAFDYDVLIGKYDNVAPELRAKYRADLLKLEQMKKEEQARAAISSAIIKRATDFQGEQKSASDAFGGLEINQPQTEAEKLRAAYKNKMAIVNTFEDMHTDKAQQAHAARVKLTEDYNQSIQDLEMQKQAQTVGSIAAMFGMVLGESSRGYKAMFAIQKAYDFVSAQSASFTAIAKAWSSAPFPANLPAVATTTLQTGVIPAAIQALAPPSLQGQAHDGIANVPREGTWMLDENERVVKADDNKKLSRFLDKNDKNSAGVNITINNNSSAEVSARRGPNGEVTIDMVDKMIEKSFRRIGRANSLESKAIQRGTTARVNRS